MAIAPIVVKPADLKGTSSGTLTARLTGTAVNSAWEAIPAPAHATRSPMLKFVTKLTFCNNYPGIAVANWFKNNRFFCRT